MKILATDMDGTFLDHLGAYDKARLDNLLDACEAKDYVFTVASGRALLALEELFDGFVDRIAIIAENGALVQYKGEVLFESKLEPKDYLQIADTTLALPTCEGILLSGRRGAYAPNDADPAYLKAMERYYENVMATDLEAVTDDIFKVTAKFQGDTIMERGDYLNTIFEDMTAVTTGFDSMDIILKGVTRALVFTIFVKSWGVRLQMFVAFGDNLNDMEMLTLRTRLLRKMRDEIKAVADEVIGHHKDGAVFDYMEGLVGSDV
ncbi:MAG: HAD hydrolase family protein [Streptococcus salivarius]